MSKIPDEEIDRIKREVDIVAVIQSRGIKLQQQGKNWIGFCPFHQDTKTPNLIVTPSKGLFRCMAACCGKTGNVIQFVQWHDGISFRHAFELLDKGGSAAFESAKQSKKSIRIKLDNPLTTPEDDDDLLEQVAKFYCNRLDSISSIKVSDYLHFRGIESQELIQKFEIGASDRTLGLRVPNSRTNEGSMFRSKLIDLGVFRSNGREHLNGCITIPIRNLEGKVVQIYGRRFDPKAPKHSRHLYLARPITGVFNPDALNSREIILTESIFDALTFWHHGMKDVTCTFGTENFSDALFEAIKAKKIESVRLAFDADAAGEKATQKIANKLQSIGVECYQVKLPWGSDANQYAKDQGGEALKKAVRDAVWLGAGVNPLSTNSSLVAKSLAAKKEDGSSEAREESPPKPEHGILKTKGDYHELVIDNRSYRVGGLERNSSLDVLRMTLRVSCEGLMHVDSLDLYRDGERKKFIERASEETMLDKALLKRDLGKLLLALERVQEARLNGEEPEEENTLTDEEKDKALKFLKAPDLLQKIAKAYDAAGLVGEATNKLAAYLACVSRKLKKPLAVIIQSTSAAGKSTLMEAVLSFFPKEEQIKYSAMTGQSLYYLGEANLKHKILAIVEEEGAEKASYALKLLQSEGELTIASTGKDPHSGRMETQEYHVEGPVSIVFTTTSIDIDEELMNRCMVLTVDESKEQTERIHELQRLARTPEGIIAAEKRKEVIQLMQNAQRLIEPMKIANPYAKYLTFTSGRTRTRRDHEKYLTLIDTIALLHQHQRETQVHKVGDNEIEMLPVTLEDIEAANAIAPEVLGRSLDELPPQTRRLLEKIKEMIREKLKINPQWEQHTTLFSRKELREYAGWSETQTRLHLERLESMEYVFRSQGKQGSRCLYQLLVCCYAILGDWQVGLIDVEKLRKKKVK